MWDEKKFFEDFSKETDQINPDEEFIKSLKTMTSEHVPAKRGPVSDMELSQQQLSCVQWEAFLSET